MPLERLDYRVVIYELVRNTYIYNFILYNAQIIDIFFSIKTSPYYTIKK